MNLYELAYSESFKELETKINSPESADWALLGLGTKQTELLNGANFLEAKDEYKNLDSETQLRVKNLEKWIWKCVENGGSLLWGMSQPGPRYVFKDKKNVFFDRARMLKKGAPGEVVRGTFKK